MDFVKKLRSGEVQIDLVDSTDVYRLGDVYFRDAAKYTHAGFEFELTKQVAKDTPWAFKNGVATKHMGSDDVQVILTENMDFPEHHIMCVAEAKTFWKAPANPNA